METGNYENVDKIFAENFQKFSRKSHWKARAWIVFIVIIMSVMTLLLRYGYTSFGLGFFVLFILVIIWLFYSGRLPRLRSDNLEKIVSFKNEMFVISCYGVSQRDLKKGDSFFLQGLQEPAIIFSKKNIRYASLKNPGKIGSLAGYSKAFFQNYFMKNPEKSVCIEFKNPLKHRKSWYNTKKLYPDLDKIYVSVDEPEKFIEYVKFRKNQQSNQSGNLNFFN